MAGILDRNQPVTVQRAGLDKTPRAATVVKTVRAPDGTVTGYDVIIAGRGAYSGRYIVAPAEVTPVPYAGGSIAPLASRNEQRSAAAALAAVDRCRRALETLGDDAAPGLAAVGRLRIAHPDVPLSELGNRAYPPLTKDAVASRLRRLCQAADRQAHRLTHEAAR